MIPSARSLAASNNFGSKSNFSFLSLGSLALIAAFFFAIKALIFSFNFFKSAIFLAFFFLRSAATTNFFFFNFAKRAIFFAFFFLSKLTAFFFLSFLVITACASHEIPSCILKRLKWSFQRLASQFK